MLDLLRNARLQGEVVRRPGTVPAGRTAKEQPFGLSRPRAQRLVKPSAPERTPAEKRRRRNGARAGHTGHGWKPPEGPKPDVEDLPAPDACPCCGGA